VRRLRQDGPDGVDLEQDLKGAGAPAPAAGTPEIALEVWEQWRLARASRLNLLLTGMPPINPLLTDVDVVIRNVLERLLPDLPEPVASWCPGEPLVLPPVPRARTMILHDVGALSTEDQQRLLEWLETDQGRAQIVSTTSVPLLPLVQAGRFDDTLYYRLNVVCVSLG
jgi:hypothetical protein